MDDSPASLRNNKALWQSFRPQLKNWLLYKGIEQSICWVCCAFLFSQFSHEDVFNCLQNFGLIILIV